jgi:predicted lipoprotein with Yx(FWY)xxD motif
MRARFVAVLAFALTLAAACSSSSSPTATASTSSSSSSTASSAASTGASSTSSSAAGATLAVATNATLGKQIVVESTGRTVYLFLPDGSSTTSQVPQSIKANWPAVTAATAPTAGDGIDASKLTTAVQPDGTQQVMYNGHLLYLFAGDKAPGDAKGQGLISEWYVLSPAGDQITS